MSVSVTSARQVMIPHLKKKYNIDKFALGCCISVICDLFQWFKSPHENIFRKQQLFIHIDVQFSTAPPTSQGPAGDEYL